MKKIVLLGIASRTMFWLHDVGEVVLSAALSLIDSFFFFLGKFSLIDLLVAARCENTLFVGFCEMLN